MSSSETTPVRQSRPIQGRVAQILNARELVINIGAEAGVTKGMKFAVMSKSPTEIRDPETQEVLDTVDREKVRVRASEVRPKITICRTFLVRTIPGRPGYSGFSGISNLLEGIRLSESVPERKVVDTLRADERDLPPPLSEEESYVKIGDRVIQIIEDEVAPF
ncbi:MAG TPA: hypothetical protein DC047_02990 [Blastocatellia bacterium]|nr:hypothetical protein [Blastocatellia bacterium]